MSAKAEHYDVIRKPVITEKATMASDANAVVFEVSIDANKPQIKEAVESLFGVKVKAVNTTITKGNIVFTCSTLITVTFYDNTLIITFHPVSLCLKNVTCCRINIITVKRKINS